MVTAASTAQLAILLVDARHGVVTQTRRHATLAHLLGIPHLVVAINKMDLVDFRETDYARIVADFRAFGAATGIDDAAVRFVPLSARDGDMVVARGDRLGWYNGPTLLHVLETAPATAQTQGGGFRFPVQYVARPEGAQRRAYLGRVEAGSIAVGDAVTALPSGRSTRVRDLRSHATAVATARSQDSIALTLDDEIDISRGDMLVGAAKAPEPARTLDATLCWFDQRPLDVRRTYLLRHTTREVRARIETLGPRWNVDTQQQDAPPEALAMNDIGEARLSLAQPVVADRYRDQHATGSFILIDEATNATVAGGLVR
jgi:sulfate adenylyltransferase subunit 1